MSWITYEAVEPLLQTNLSADAWIGDLIDHATELIEAEVGAQDPADLPDGLAAILAQVTARLWRAGRAANQNPAGLQQDTLGPHSFTAGNLAAGFGLTKAERDQLARYRSPLWIQPTHRASALETAPAELVEDAAGGDPIPWIALEDAEVTE